MFEVPTADVTRGISRIEIEPCGVSKESAPLFIPVLKIAKIGPDVAGKTRITVDPNKSPALMKVWSKATSLMVIVTLKGNKELKPIELKDFKKSMLRRQTGLAPCLPI